MVFLFWTFTQLGRWQVTACLLSGCSRGPAAQGPRACTDPGSTPAKSVHRGPIRHLAAIEYRHRVAGSRRITRTSRRTKMGSNLVRTSI